MPVRKPLRVAVFSTGDEVVSPGEALRPAAVYDANRFMLRAMLRRLGCRATDLGILPDEPRALAGALAQAAAGHDLILTSGGVSTGEEDHVKAAVEAAGALAFWRLGIKPGRPVAMGVVAGTPFIGLPGNPVAVFVTFATSRARSSRGSRARAMRPRALSRSLPASPTARRRAGANMCGSASRRTPTGGSSRTSTRARARA